MGKTRGAVQHPDMDKVAPTSDAQLASNISSVEAEQPSLTPVVNSAWDLEVGRRETR